jgi:hypothetical protein
MHCSTCGALIPAGRSECGTCGGRVERSGALAVPGAVGGSAAALNASLIPECPKCEYRGYGITYFSRGTHIAGLVAATIVTLPGAFGAGGLLYYWLRHDHRICPRCGTGWGARGELVRTTPLAVSPAASQPVRVSRGGEGVLRAWSIMRGLVAAAMLVVGGAELELLLIALGVLAGTGAFMLHRGANAARERRREALLANLQLNVLKLADERRGRLTVTEVATALSWPMRRAEKVLNSLDDGWRVNSTVTDEGVIVYEFRELLHG